jgi:hypothetical protein
MFRTHVKLLSLLEFRVEDRAVERDRASGNRTQISGFISGRNFRLLFECQYPTTHFCYQDSPGSRDFLQAGRMVEFDFWKDRADLVRGRGSWRAAES